MNDPKLKLELLDKLVSVTDGKLLNQIHLILKDIDINVNPYKLNNQQITMVNESESDYISGKVYSNKSVFLEDEEWLKNQ